MSLVNVFSSRLGQSRNRKFNESSLKITFEFRTRAENPGKVLSTSAASTKFMFGLQAS